MKASDVPDAIGTRDEAMARTARAIVDLLPTSSKSPEVNSDAAFKRLNIPQLVCLLFIFRDMD